MKSEPVFPPVRAIREEVAEPGRAALASLHSVMWGHTKRKGQLLAWSTVVATIVGGLISMPWGLAAGLVVGAGIAIWIESTAQAPLQIRTMTRWAYLEGRRRWLSETGVEQPHSPSGYRTFLASPTADRISLTRRSDALRYAGEFVEARRLLDLANPRTPAESKTSSALDLNCSLSRQVMAIGDHGSPQSTKCRLTIPMHGRNASKWL